MLQGRLIARVVQRTVSRLREQRRGKLSRLPLSYFDQQPRGEVLSRATNDTDNIAQTLQQTLAQLVTSVLTIIGVLALMFWISWLLALIALVTVPVSILLTTLIGKRSQPQFVAQWATTGKLNGHIEEMFTGHSLVKVFGRQQEAAADVRPSTTTRCSRRASGPSSSPALIQPAMMFIGNVNYVLVAVVGGLRVASGALSLGDVQAFIQYSRQFSQPLTQVASDGQPDPVRGGLGRAGLRAARRARAERPTRCAGRPGAGSAGGSPSRTCRSATCRTSR